MPGYQDKLIHDDCQLCLEHVKQPLHDSIFGGLGNGNLIFRAYSENISETSYLPMVESKKAKLS